MRVTLLRRLGCRAAVSVVGGALLLAAALLATPSPARAADAPSGAVAAGPEHTCALLAVGAPTCWGRGTDGRLGNGAADGVADGIGPTLRRAGSVALGARAQAVAVGDAHSCALLSKGAVRCWGDDAQGQLGYASSRNVGDGVGPSPVTAPNVPLPRAAVAVAAGGDASCALLHGGAVTCWGAALAPHAVALPAAAVAVATNGDQSCAALRDGAVDCWIAGAPQAITLSGPATRVVVGASRSCALLDHGAVECWGADGAASALTLGQPASDVGLGGAQGCALLVDSTVSCWTGDAAPQPTGVSATALSVGPSDVCTLTDAGRPYCWGDGAYGKLGRGDVVSRTPDGEPARAHDTTVPTTTMTFGGTSQATATAAARRYADATPSDRGFPWWLAAVGAVGAAALAVGGYLARRRLAGRPA